MTGWVGASGEPEPVSWVRKHGESRVFYTSLGHQKDFEDPAFTRLLYNAIRWAVSDE